MRARYPQHLASNEIGIGQHRFVHLSERLIPRSLLRSLRMI